MLKTLAKLWAIGQFSNKEELKVLKNDHAMKKVTIFQN